MIGFAKNLIRLLYHKYKQPRAKIVLSAVVSLDCKLGEFVRIFSNARLGSCNISRFCYIGSKCDFARTTIAPFTSIGSEVLSGLGTHPLNYVSTYPGFYSRNVSGSKWFGIDTDFKEIENKSVSIGADVWIGSRAIILGGVSIGHGAVIGAGAIVTKDVPPYAIVGGVPAKVIRYRFDSLVIKNLIDSQWWNLSEDLLREAAQYIPDPEKFLDYIKQKTISINS